MNRAKIKEAAREQIKGNLWRIFGIIVIMGVIIGAVSSITQGISTLLIEAGMSATTVSLVSALIFIINIFIAAPFELSMAKLFINLTEGVRPQIGDAFWGFNYMVKSVSVAVRMIVFIYLWTLVFIIPGFVKSYSYMMMPYIIADNPNMSSKAAMKLSIEMMKGHKWELFVLHLSFIGWGILTALTFGILAIYVVPYMEASVANFYQRLKRDEDSQMYVE